jgi:hypothetical protein
VIKDPFLVAVILVLLGYLGAIAKAFLTLNLTVAKHEGYHVQQGKTNTRLEKLIEQNRESIKAQGDFFNEWRLAQKLQQSRPEH